MNNDEVVGVVVATTVITIFGFGWALVGAGAIVAAHRLACTSN